MHNIRLVTTGLSVICNQSKAVKFPNLAEQHGIFQTPTGCFHSVAFPGHFSHVYVSWTGRSQTSSIVFIHLAMEKFLLLQVVALVTDVHLAHAHSPPPLLQVG